MTITDTDARRAANPEHPNGARRPCSSRQAPGLGGRGEQRGGGRALHNFDVVTAGSGPSPTANRRAGAASAGRPLSSRRPGHGPRQTPNRSRVDEEGCCPTIMLTNPIVFIENQTPGEVTPPCPPSPDPTVLLLERPVAEAPRSTNPSPPAPPIASPDPGPGRARRPPGLPVPGPGPGRAGRLERAGGLPLDRGHRRRAGPDPGPWSSPWRRRARRPDPSHPGTVAAPRRRPAAGGHRCQAVVLATAAVLWNTGMVHGGPRHRRPGAGHGGPRRPGGR